MSHVSQRHFLGGVKWLLAAAVALVLTAAVGVAAAVGGTGLTSPLQIPSAPPAGASTAVTPATAGDLSFATVATVASDAGFSGSDLVMAIAVAFAESSGNPHATDLDDNGTVDRGLWQINSVHAEFSAACDFDPACAAKAAYSISAGGSDWNAWVTYRHGAEIPYLPTAVAAVAAGATS